MRFILRRRLAGLILAFTLGPILLTVHPQAQQRTARPGYIGDDACAQCHREQSSGYALTGHHLTSQIASRKSILGNFSPGNNVLKISDPAVHPALPSLFFTLEEKNGNFHETAVTEKIDIVTGSGQRGQTYLYWQGNQLLELPVSYWTDGHRWVNSPGYTDGTADFSRPINPGCLECHATYIRPLSTETTTNSYEKDSLITGLSCETCHGPGAAHAAQYAKDAPRSANHAASGILNPANFSRDRQVDACAWCHSGIQREALKPAFSFVPGSPLSDYFKALPGPVSDHPDVHGNQVGLLQRSRCYVASPSLSCSTCHDVHRAQKITVASYSQKCLGCHQWKSCGEARKIGPSSVRNCIDCHMPVQNTNVIVSETAGHVVKAAMRNHWIKIYDGLPRH
jgi:hypothetical protein